MASPLSCMSDCWFMVWSLTSEQRRFRKGCRISLSTTAIFTKYGIIEECYTTMTIFKIKIDASIPHAHDLAARPGRMANLWHVTNDCTYLLEKNEEITK